MPIDESDLRQAFIETKEELYDRNLITVDDLKRTIETLSFKEEFMMKIFAKNIEKLLKKQSIEYKKQIKCEHEECKKIASVHLCSEHFGNVCIDF